MGICLMKVSLVALLLVASVLGAQNWAGSNLYYAAGLSQSQQDYLFSNLQSAGCKVIRVWLDGQNSGSTKNTPITSFPDLEPNTIGQYDDTVLNLLDGVMLTANKYGIKLLISMHSWNALEGGDVYYQNWGTTGYYEEQDAFNAIDNRFRHVLNHTHTTLGKKWKDLPEYIFAFEAENEAMIGIDTYGYTGQSFIESHTAWQCDRAQAIREALGEGNQILVTTGGESWLDESLQDPWFSCEYLDILAIHAYGVGDFSTEKLMGYVQKAWDNGKMLLFQEWGACYWSSENNTCDDDYYPLASNTRDYNIKGWANNISAAGIPWMYWEIIPNADPHWNTDYEIGIDDVNWNTFQQVANYTSTYQSSFDYSPYLSGL